jgi:hypothetical protein
MMKDGTLKRQANRHRNNERNSRNTVTERNPNSGSWLPGKSGNPGGRPIGSRQKISEALLGDLAEVWAERGQAVLHRLAVDDPGKLATIAYGLLPKDVFVRVEDQRTPGNLDADAYAALRSLLDVIERSKIEGDPQSVFERIERYLRSEAALEIEADGSKAVAIEHSDTEKVESVQVDSGSD